MDSGHKRWVDSRWFGLADLACAVIGGLWWYGQPGIGGWPLFIALAPWALRLASRHPPIRRTPFDALVIVFVLTAFMGVWAAYDRATAWAKLWVIMGAILLYYALAAQPEANDWLLACLLSVLGAAVAGYFLLTYDWQAFPRHFASLDRIGVWWMSIRPALPGSIQPNVAGGLLAMLLPFPIAGLIRAWREARRPLIIFNIATGGLALLGLLLTSSRGAWGALAIALVAWGLWALGGAIASRLRWPRRAVSVTLLFVAVSAGLAAILIYPGRLEALANRVSDGQSRYEVAYNTIRLLADFPFTGGGLGAFTGLYSRYMLVIYVPYLTYSHDFFLDVALEQGLFGLLALLGILGGSLWLLARQQPSGSGQGLVRWALITGLLVIGLHGLLDDPLYGNRGTPLLLVLAGFAVALARAASHRARQPTAAINEPRVVREAKDRQFARLGAAAACVLAGAAILFGLGPRLAGAWYADLGAVLMARIELAGWSVSPWDAPIPASAFGPAKALFEQSLRLDPVNRTAHYRLGLIAAREDDYPQAIADLESAHQTDPGHRGVTKSLGYDYTWLGQLGRAQAYLTSIPEAPAELDAYAWWWDERGQPDRSAYAAQMAALLRGGAAIIDGKPVTLNP